MSTKEEIFTFKLILTELGVGTSDHDHRGRRRLSSLIETSTGAAINGISPIVIGMASHLTYSAARAPKGAAAIITFTAGGGWDVVLLANLLPRPAQGNQDVHHESNDNDGYDSCHGFVSRATGARLSRAEIAISVIGADGDAVSGRF